MYDSSTEMCDNYYFCINFQLVFFCIYMMTLCITLFPNGLLTHHSQPVAIEFNFLDQFLVVPYDLQSTSFFCTCTCTLYIIIRPYTYKPVLYYYYYHNNIYIMTITYVSIMIFMSKVVIIILLYCNTNSIHGRSNMPCILLHVRTVNSGTSCSGLSSEINNSISKTILDLVRTITEMSSVAIPAIIIDP